MDEHVINVSAATLLIAGVEYPPGATIPVSADPAQVAHWVAIGLAQPPPAPHRPVYSEAVREVSVSDGAPVTDWVEEPDGDDRL